ncbi:MAG: hypothetical protein M1818_003791 [Claussenomyces sp. TS43310]|nr:MAG: hypothetical protein M1818_003791 [Claussenomyces sp. TS43310]
MDAAQRTNADVLHENSTDDLHERNNFLISELLTRFQNIVKLAPMPEGEVTKQVAAAQAFQTKVETAALIKAAEDLLKLSRELKELWLFGPLRDLGEGDSNPQMEEDAEKVEKMILRLLNQADQMAVLK